VNPAGPERGARVRGGHVTYPVGVRVASDTVDPANPRCWDDVVDLPEVGHRPPEGEAGRGVGRSGCPGDAACEERPGRLHPAGSGRIRRSTHGPVVGTAGRSGGTKSTGDPGNEAPEGGGIPGPYALRPRL